MRKTVIKKIVIGFLVGAACGNLISLMMSLFSGGDIRLISEALGARLGTVLGIAVQSVLSGIYGAVCVGGTVYYDIDDWSLLKATLIHYLSIMVSFSVVSAVLSWLPPDVLTYLAVILTFTFVFFIIWLVMYLRWKKQIAEMNRELTVYKSEMDQSESDRP